MGKMPLYPHIPGARKPKYPHQAGGVPGDYHKFYSLIEADLHSEGEYDPDVIMTQLINEVLEGYRDRDEAWQDAQTMRETGGRRYSKRGYEITPEVIEQAIGEALKLSFFGPIRRELVEQTVEARKLTQKVAITEKHPACKEYQELWNQLNWAEQREVRKKAPGMVAGYRD